MLDNIYILILCIAIGTYLTRSLFMVFFKHVDLPEVVVNGLKYLPIAILTSLIVPSVFMPTGQLDISFSNFYIVALIITVIVMLISKKSILSIMSGMAALIILNNIF